MAPRKSGYLVAIAAAGHGAPAPPAGAGVVIEEETAGRIGAEAKAGALAFGDQLRAGACDGGEEPVETSFAGDKLEAPFPCLLDEFVVAFGYP